MAQNFMACDREQSFLLPPDVREWLPEEHLAWFVIDAVGVIETAAFYAAYREDGHGRAAYEPSMMIALLLYCWSRGVRSSRAIERACVEDVACRVIAAPQQPDHTTIARFVERHENALGELFGEVLVLCADAGLATVGVIAIDGTKVNANVSRDRTVDYEQLARTIIEEAITTDAAETATRGQLRGDELPEIVARRQGRADWLRAARQRLDQQRAEKARPIPRSRPQFSDRDYRDPGSCSRERARKPCAAPTRERLPPRSCIHGNTSDGAAIAFLARERSLRMPIAEPRGTPGTCDPEPATRDVGADWCAPAGARQTRAGVASCPRISDSRHVGVELASRTEAIDQHGPGAQGRQPATRHEAQAQHASQRSCADVAPGRS